MTRWLWLLIPGGSLAILFLWIKHHFQAEGVSPEWLREDQRRRSALGVEQSCWKWPYRGYQEEG